MSLTEKRLVSTGNLSSWGLSAKGLIGYMRNGGVAPITGDIWLLYPTFPEPVGTTSKYINPDVNKISFSYYCIF